MTDTEQPEETKPCTGCKHLVASGAACRADDGAFIRQISALTGRVAYIPVNGRVFRPSPEEMRAVGGKCGPCRKLYKPTLLARLLPSLFG